MKKKIKIVLGILLGIVVLCALAWFIWLGILKWNEQEERGWWPGEREAYTLTETYPTDIIWFGKQYPLGYEVNVRYEDEISHDTLKIRNGFDHAYIVLSDRDGALDLTEAELRLIKNLVATDERYNFVYIGNEANPILEDIGFRGQQIDLSTSVSYSEMHVDGKLEALCGGVPIDVDDENLWMYIFANLAHEWYD